ncbi:hypothetical protein SAMN05421508_11034 [Caenispirillum bisanense]|uniref:Uncharacterized protein n=1 Tax=Caenispirillum bisanense TaxID=414052 RepID=A0A286GWC1_9PROT|nr:hypothetical protein SAMN05421508_11034 [Caenispirillum bisanense]
MGPTGYHGQCRLRRRVEQIEAWQPALYRHERCRDLAAAWLTMLARPLQLS